MSWRTTTLGVITIVSALLSAAKALIDSDPSTSVDYATVTTAVAAGWGLIAARDNKVASESVGAK